MLDCFVEVKPINLLFVNDWIKEGSLTITNSEAADMSVIDDMIELDFPVLPYEIVCRQLPDGSLKTVSSTKFLNALIQFLNGAATPKGIKISDLSHLKRRMISCIFRFKFYIADYRTPDDTFEKLKNVIQAMDEKYD